MAAVQTKILRIIQEVNIDDHDDADDNNERKNNTGKRAKSPFRLAWYRAEGWRQQLRASGDIVESCRWTWRVDDQLLMRAGEGTGDGEGGTIGRGGRVNRVPQIVATVPSAMRRTASNNTTNTRNTRTPMARTTIGRIDTSKPLPPLPHSRPRWRPPGRVVHWEDMIVGRANSGRRRRSKSPTSPSKSPVRPLLRRSENMPSRP